jgi:hypothetical protein
MTNREKAEKIVNWMADQKYQGEELLHAIICCDYASKMHFIDAVAKQLDACESTVQLQAIDEQRQQYDN